MVECPSCCPLPCLSPFPVVPSSSPLFVPLSFLLFLSSLLPFSGIAAFSSVFPFPVERKEKGRRERVRKEKWKGKRRRRKEGRERKVRGRREERGGRTGGKNRDRAPPALQRPSAGAAATSDLQAKWAPDYQPPFDFRLGCCHVSLLLCKGSAGALGCMTAPGSPREGTAECQWEERLLCPGAETHFQRECLSAHGSSLWTMLRDLSAFRIFDAGNTSLCVRVLLGFWRKYLSVCEEFLRGYSWSTSLCMRGRPENF